MDSFDLVHLNIYLKFHSLVSYRIAYNNLGRKSGVETGVEILKNYLWHLIALRRWRDFGWWLVVRCPIGLSLITSFITAVQLVLEKRMG